MVNLKASHNFAKALMKNSNTGIVQTSAIALMGELLLLPSGLSHREWVKFAGLDPRAFDSGKSAHKPARLSKAGNRHPFGSLHACP